MTGKPEGPPRGALKVRHFATHDSIGGAAKAEYHLERALADAGHESRLVVKDKRSADDTVHRVPVAWLRGVLRTFFHIAQFRKGLLPKPACTFRLDVKLVINLRRLPGDDRGRPDVLCLDWVAVFLRSGSIRRIHGRVGRPLFWVLMDLESFPGRRLPRIFRCSTSGRRSGRGGGR